MAPRRSPLPIIACALAWPLATAPAASAGVLSPESAGAQDMRTIAVIAFAVVVVLGLLLHGAILAALARRRRTDQLAKVSQRGVQTRVAVGLGSLAAALFVLGVVFTESARKAEPTGPEGLSASAALSAQVNPTNLPRALDEQLRAENQAVELGDPLVVRAIGQQWVWRFEHPGGRAGARNFAYGELVLPTNTLVRLDVGSIDVLHRWWVPELGGKVDAVPGKQNRTWLNVAEEGVYEGRSAAYSGAGYPSMRIAVRTVSPQAYLAYLETLERELAEAQEAAQADEQELDPLTDEELPELADPVEERDQQ